MSDYLPARPDESSARSRFNTLLARVLEQQLARTVQNELRARKQPDAAWSWNENRYHLAPVTGASRVVPVDAWAAFIRKGGDPTLSGIDLAVMPDSVAERALPAADMRHAW